ncbi:hypothetical protein N9Y70_02455 [Methylophilaceae bacterium]|nr:hypothetical protein [Methylophilaceae bacterium]
MKILLILPMFFCSLAFSEDFNLICEGERKVRILSGKKFNVTDFESVLLKINNNAMEYIGVNSGRSYFFSNREYSAPKRPPHKDIKITEQYQYTPKIIKASQIIADTGDSEETSISLFSLNVNLLTGILNETEIISNKKTNLKSVSNSFQGFCKKEDRPY